MKNNNVEVINMMQDIENGKIRVRSLAGETTKEEDQITDELIYDVNNFRTGDYVECEEVCITSCNMILSFVCEAFDDKGNVKNVYYVVGNLSHELDDEGNRLEGIYVYKSRDSIFDPCKANFLIGGAYQNNRLLRRLLVLLRDAVWTER